MAVNALGTIPSSADVQSSSNSQAMGKDEFLTLLVAQLQSQDPLNPMDGTAFTAQLAQFSSLEQLQNLNSSVENMVSSQSSLKNAQAVDLIGKTVIADGKTIGISDGAADDIKFDLNAEAASVYVKVYDSAGNFVHDINAGALSAGSQSLSWDGNNGAGLTMADGNYTFEVLAVGANNEVIGSTTYTTGTVQGVSFKNGSAYLDTGNQEIPLASVIRVEENAG